LAIEDCLLADRDVDALNAGALLVDDGVDRDRGLAGLAVTDDQLALAAADGTIASIALRPVCTGWLTDWRAITPGATFSIGEVQRGIDRALAVDRIAERIDHAADQLGADRHFEDAPGARRCRLPDVACRAQHHGAHRIALEVQRHAVDAAGELDHFAVHDLGQAVDAARCRQTG
jgi:hypothetical protein